MNYFEASRDDLVLALIRAEKRIAYLEGYLAAGKFDIAPAKPADDITIAWPIAGLDQDDLYLNK
jgi:hypothetical protein